jgi:hypothetical protein
VEDQVEALLATIYENIPVNFGLCDVSKQIRSLKFGKACGFDGIPNEGLVTHLVNHCLWLGHFLAPWKEEKIITLLNPAKNPKFMSDQPLFD